MVAPGSFANDSSDESTTRHRNVSGSRSRSRNVASDEQDNVNLVYAQKLNNSAAMCMQTEYYDRAIESLHKALKYSQKLSDVSLAKCCNCKLCEADGCIDFSADFESDGTAHRVGGAFFQVGKNRHGHDDDDDSSCSSCSSEDESDYGNKRKLDDAAIASMTKSISQPKVQKVCRDTNSSNVPNRNASWALSNEYCENEINEPCDEVYKRPIRVTQEGHPMGSTLFLVITFNLAIAHHLEVLSTYRTETYDRKFAKKTLLFYELTSTYEKRVFGDAANKWDALASLRFNTILNNNINQIFHMLPEKCLPAAQRLLSTTMKAIDSHTEALLSKRSGNKASLCVPSLGSKTKSTSSWSTKSIGTNNHDGSNNMSFSSRTSNTSFGSLSAMTLSGKSPRVSPYIGGKKKLHLALGDLAPSPSNGKNKLHIALGDMAPTSQKSRNKLSRVKESSRKR